MVGRPHQWKRSLQRYLKGSSDPLDQIGTVYKIKCKECSESDIGETGRTARIRSAEHFAHAKHGRVGLSAVAELAILKDHQIDWKNPEIIDHETRTARRKVKQAL